MRLPRMTQLTPAQKQVYFYAATDRHVLVQGPPGTGKTLIACLRAQELTSRGWPFVLAMFSRVLVKYSSNVADGGSMPCETVLGWFRKWWHASGLPPHPQSGHVCLQVPWADRQLAREAGARWHRSEWRPWEKRPGVWMVEASSYLAQPQRFSRWRVWHVPPQLPDSQSVDWNAVASHILAHEDALASKCLDIGTFLLDEGQDFPPDFYRTLRQLSAIGQARKVAHPLRCFVLADENQQLTDQNSTLNDIVGALNIAEEDRYQLLDNFRNTREIAELARQFFADVGVLPKLPEESGARPMYLEVSDHAALVGRVRVWLSNNPGKEAGVLTFSESTRASLYSALARGLPASARTVRVQTYSWQSRQVHPPEDLVFDGKDIVTVLNMQSCKGLEFDAVFIADLHDARIGLYGPDRFRMQMFVAVSRARTWVSLVDSGAARGTGGFAEYLPGPEFLERAAAAVGAPRHAGAAVRTIETAGQPALSNGGWEQAVQALDGSGELKVLHDYRAQGGALWVQDAAGVGSLLKPLGFNYAEGRGAWWKK